MDKFELVTNFTPSEDQKEAIDKLNTGLDNGFTEQTLLGVTGSGKTFTMANIIAEQNRPTLVLAHNKTLAAQLCAEFKEFFPNNSVEYFVSYFDYYQPEAYIPHTDTFIEKDSSINEEIDRLRHSATASLFERRDVIIVASVSCIYGLGNPEDYSTLVVSIRQGMHLDRDTLIRKLIDIHYERNDVSFTRTKFRVRGDTIEILPSWSDDTAIRIEYFGDDIDRICEISALTGKVNRIISHAMIYPANHHTTTQEKTLAAISEIKRELDARVAELKAADKLVEAQRLLQRTSYDLELMEEIGYCSGIENYSRILAGREAGSAPYTLLDYFPKDFLMFIDESHVSVPQIRGMSAGDRARKTVLVDYGFRLPSAFDNRPLYFSEFENKVNQVIYVSATPSDYEKSRSSQIVEQVIRPTGLLDPEVEIRPSENQIDDLMEEISGRTAVGERTLVTTLTKKMAEDLTSYLAQNGMRVRYLHHNVENIERMEIIRDLRLGKFDVLVGINLLREGLDLPEVSLITILDADKEGFLRSETALVQIIGRAARNVHGKVIMYADRITPSMHAAISETNRRRALQKAYNEKHGIIPSTIVKDIRGIIEISKEAVKENKEADKLNAKQRNDLIAELEKSMKEASKLLDFEYAAVLRDRIIELRSKN